MDGVLLVHASTGHILLSKAYAPGFGLRSAGGADGAQRDPTVAAMLLANFLCALYTNVRDLIELPPQPAAGLPDDDGAAHDWQQRQLQQLMRDPLRSLDTGADGPLLFFRRHQSTNVFCALFLRRSLLDGRGSGAASEAAAAEAIGGDGSACTLAMEGAGDWLAATLLHSFVSQFQAELSARPLRAGTKAFRPWLKTAEEIYAAAFSRELVRRVAASLSEEWSPHWLYALYSDRFVGGTEREQAERHRAAAFARGVQSERGRGRGAPGVEGPAQQHRRRASGSVADAASVVAQPPAFVPRPPAHPSPASVAAAAAAAAAGASSSSAGAAVPPVPSSFASSYPSTRPLAPTSGARFPFQPPVRRWWHFGRSKDAPELFFQNVGRTTCFYSFGDGLAPAAPLWEEEQGVDKLEEAPQGLSPAAAANSSASLHSSPLPSPEALRRLIALVHHSSMVLSAPSEIADHITSIEVTLREPAPAAAAAAPPVAASRARVGQTPLPDPIAVAPAPSAAPSSTKLWIFRVRHLVLAFPTPSAAPIQPAADALSPALIAAAGRSVPAPRHCTMPALLATLRPLLHCLDVHYAFVAGIHERAERALQKSMEKMSKDKAAAK